MTAKTASPSWKLERTNRAGTVRLMVSSVARRTAVLLSILLVIIAACLGIWALTSIKANVKESARQSLQIVLETSREAMEIWVRDKQNALRTIAFHRRLVELSAAQVERHERGQQLLPSPELEELRQLFLDYREVGEHLGFFVIAPDGTSVASIRDANIGSVNLIQEHCPDLLARAFAGETVLIPPIVSDVPLPGAANVAGLDRPPTMFFATPLRNTDGEVLAVLTERFDPHAGFTGINLLGRIGRTGETYTFDQQGRLLSESRFLDDLVATGLIQAGEQGILSVEVRDPGGNLLAGFTDAPRRDEQPLTRMAASATGGEADYDVEGYRDYRGVRVFGAWAWNTRRGIGMATEIDAAEAMAPYRSARLAITVILAITVAVAIAFTSWLLALANRTNRSLRSTHKLEQLVAGISAALLKASPAEVDLQIDLALRKVGQVLSMDRIALWWFDEKKENARASHSWVRPGVSALPAAIDLSQIPWILANLLAGESVSFSRTDEIPADALLDRRLVAAVDMKSYLATPLTVGGSLAGGCSFSTALEERQWPSELVDSLTVVGQILASSVARSQADAALRERLELEGLITEISAALGGLPAVEIDHQVEIALERIGEFLKVDIVELWKLDSEDTLQQLDPDQTVWALTHGWLRPGVTKPPEKELGSELPTLAAAALRREVFRFSSVDELPTTDRELAIKRGIRSHLLIPLRVGKSLVGAFVIATSHAERAWPDYLIRVLSIVSELFAGILTRKRSEENLQASREQLRVLASELITLEERERRQIAIYLHDQIAQTLAVSRMKLGGLATIVDSGEVRQGVEEIRDLLEEAIDDTQELTFDVSPPILYELGLAPAIEWIGEKLARQNGLRIDFFGHTNDVEFGPNKSALLFRATRELMMNIVKHAEASSVAVSLAKEGRTFRIEVKDDGIGFDTSILDPRHGVTSFGLSSVRERMDYAGGRVEVESRPGAGTRICLIMPLPDRSTTIEGAGQ